MNKLAPKARIKDLVIQEIEGETLVYDLSSNKAFCLNETSALVWQLCDGKHSVEKLSDEISKHLKTLISEDLVWLAIEQLNEDGLLEEGAQFGNHFTGLSRREVVIKVGFASLVALPVVTSLVTPQAAAAQSCSGLNGGCNLNVHCCSNNCLSIGLVGTCCHPSSVGPFGTNDTICIDAPNSCSNFQDRCCSNSITDSGIAGPGGLCVDPTNRVCTCN